MSILNVFFEQELVGTLNRDEELTYSFAYDSKWLKSPNKFQLSLALPLQKETFGNRLTLSYFENLLPEGEVREVLEKDFHFKSSFDFLKEFGKDCAGAIIVADSEISPFSPTKNEIIEIEMKKIYKAIENKRSVVEVISDMEPGYLSLAGAQDKFPAIYKNKKFYLPINGVPTTHIAKVPIWRMNIKESVYNEYYCMKLAEAVGFNIPKCHVIENKSHPLFIIERYDREIARNGIIQRVHQQDFCQAQGIVSDNKYEAKGGPTLKDNYNLILKHVWIKKRKESLFAFLDWVCFNLLIGNNDCHSKNLSFVLKNNKIELAPFYDLLCTALYPKLTKQFSFKIGGRDDASRIGKNQLNTLDKELELKPGTMIERMLRMREMLLEHKEVISNHVLNIHPQVKIVKRISDLIKDRCKSLDQQGLTNK